MKRLYKALFGTIVCASVLATSSCTTETVYVEPESGITRQTVSPRRVEMGYADEVSFTVVVRPGATKYTWESSDPSIAYVDENDRIVPQGTGQVEFTCRAGDYVQTIEAVITSSIVKTKDYRYFDEGAENTLECIRVLPETTAFTVTSDNEEVVSVLSANALNIKAESAGVATITVTTEDGIVETLSVGVANAENTIAPAAATAFFYNGEPLGHVGYGISALALTPAGATYTDGGAWSDGTAGMGLFLKVFNPSQSDFASIPDGTYMHGDGENNFYADKSYIIDVATGTRTPLTTGELEIAANSITGYVAAGSTVYKVDYSGMRTETAHTYPYSELVYDYNADSFPGSSSVVIDHNGTYFFRDAGNAWRWQLTLSGSDYLQLFTISYDTDNPEGDYPVSAGFFEKGTCVGMGWGHTSCLVYNGQTSNIVSGQVKVKNYTHDSSITAGFEGELGGMISDPVSEIGESRTIPFSIKLNVESLTFAKYEY